MTVRIKRDARSVPAIVYMLPRHHRPEWGLNTCWVMLSRTENRDFGLRWNKIKLARTKNGVFGPGYKCKIVRAYYFATR